MHPGDRERLSNTVSRVSHDQSNAADSTFQISPLPGEAAMSCE